MRRACSSVPSRREMLVTSIVAMIGVANWSRRPAAQVFRRSSGCYISPAELDQLVLANLPPDRHPWDPATGAINGKSRQGADFDRALGRVLVMMTEVFDVSPGFGFYDDGAGMNALAAPVSRVDGTSGTVVFGLDMLDDQMQRNGDVAVAAICAHEFGHIFQYASGAYSDVRRRLPSYCTELHADFLAGFFLRRFAAERPSIRLAGVERSWARLGSSDFNRPGTHGTSEQRALAIKEGYFHSDGGGLIDDGSAAAFDHVRQYG